MKNTDKIAVSKTKIGNKQSIRIEVLPKNIFTPKHKKYLKNKKQNTKACYFFHDTKMG
jgi:hypothetical protein